MSRPVQVHVSAFLQFDICVASRPVKPIDPIEDRPILRLLLGQWKEVIKFEADLTCEHCKLILILLRANHIEHLFDSNQRQMEAELRRLMS